MPAAGSRPRRSHQGLKKIHEIHVPERPAHGRGQHPGGRLLLALVQHHEQGQDTEGKVRLVRVKQLGHVHSVLGRLRLALFQPLCVRLRASQLRLAAQNVHHAGVCHILFVSLCALIGALEVFGAVEIDDVAHMSSLVPGRGLDDRVKFHGGPSGVFQVSVAGESDLHGAAAPVSRLEAQAAGRKGVENFANQKAAADHRANPVQLPVVLQSRLDAGDHMGGVVRVDVGRADSQLEHVGACVGSSKGDGGGGSGDLIALLGVGGRVVDVGQRILHAVAVGDGHAALRGAYDIGAVDFGGGKVECGKQIARAFRDALERIRGQHIDRELFCQSFRHKESFLTGQAV
nr:MAG TPA: hypothetical protein [Caudoviricetes sp.]